MRRRTFVQSLFTPLAFLAPGAGAEDEVEEGIGDLQEFRKLAEERIEEILAQWTGVGLTSTHIAILATEIDTELKRLSLIEGGNRFHAVPEMSHHHPTTIFTVTVRVYEVAHKADPIFREVEGKDWFAEAGFRHRRDSDNG